MAANLVWILVMLLGGTWWVHRDIAVFARFGQLADAAARRRIYRT